MENGNLKRVSLPKPEEQKELKQKQKKSIVEEFNKPDPIGDAVRDIWSKVRGKESKK